MDLLNALLCAARFWSLLGFCAALLGAFVWLFASRCVYYGRKRVLVLFSEWVRILILVIGSLVWLNDFLLDGLEGMFNGYVLGEDTYYSSGYSASGFKKLQLGMSKDQVRSLLGQPLDKYPILRDGREGWRYSWRHTDTHYRIRVVIFREGKVDDIKAEFYVD